MTTETKKETNAADRESIANTFFSLRQEQAIKLERALKMDMEHMISDLQCALKHFSMGASFPLNPDRVAQAQIKIAELIALRDQISLLDYMATEKPAATICSCTPSEQCALCTPPDKLAKEATDSRKED